MKQFYFLYKKENLSTLFRLKPTIIIFSLLIRVSTPKKNID